MAKRRVKYGRKMEEMHGMDLHRLRKSKKKHLFNLKVLRKKMDKMKVGGPGSRKIRRNIVRNLPGYKNGYMRSAWKDHQIKTHGAEMLRILREMAKPIKDRSQRIIIKYFRQEKLNARLAGRFKGLAAK